jgi:hypothetical protein
LGLKEANPFCEAPWGRDPIQAIATNRLSEKIRSGRLTARELEREQMRSLDNVSPSAPTGAKARRAFKEERILQRLGSNFIVESAQDLKNARLSQQGGIRGGS